jgi:CRISPR system Cascade subunit CasA
MNNASTLTERDAARRPHSIVALGQSANKAKIEFWRAERFSLPAGVAADGIARAQLRSLLADAEKSQIALWRACQSFARNILGHGTRQPSPQDVTAFVAQMPVTPCYWSMLEARFHDLLEKAESQREFEDVRANWLTAIREAIERAWSIHATTIAFDDAWSIRALVKAEVQVGREIRWLDKEIAELTATLVST